MNHWIDDAVFYHIYPLGFCGAPRSNDFVAAPIQRLDAILPWLDHIQSLGANALYLGPVFESSSHGYDTSDYYWLDRRLGTNETLAWLSAKLHERGMHLVLDGVFNHVGRNFWAFRDLLAHGQSSPYCGWFKNLRFNQSSPFNDPFSYEGWNGHYSLVKLNLQNREVRDHLFGAVKSWVDQFDLDGLRLDAADCLSFDFLSDLSAFCRGLRPDFWLMGEVIHGDYRQWASPARLDSVTNYECYKGLYSSLAEHNYFEIAYALNRQFGAEGVYRDLPLYNFVDNHDVNRAASMLNNPAHLPLLYTLLMTMPGVPSIYYGSEWGLQAVKTATSDLPLRPQLDLAALNRQSPQPQLPALISRLAGIRHTSAALQSGSYQQLLVESQQLVFLREAQGERVVTALNAADSPALLTFHLPGGALRLMDLLHPAEEFCPQGETCSVPVPAYQARILKAVGG